MIGIILTELFFATNDTNLNFLDENFTDPG